MKLLHDMVKNILQLVIGVNVAIVAFMVFISQFGEQPIRSWASLYDAAMLIVPFAASMMAMWAIGGTLRERDMAS